STTMPSTISILAIFLLFGGTNGDSVTQTEGPVTLSEGAPMILNCTYQSSYTTSPVLFWYVQYLNNAPQLLLKSSTETEDQGFQANLVKSENSFHLQKRSLQISDSALYYCAMRDTVRRTAGGAEHKP
uniref:Ig-like domain-containing protein n=1 Tax=Loxodonta africana TaxID=9785 RepID=G3UH10_LOXAF